AVIDGAGLGRPGVWLAEFDGTRLVRPGVGLADGRPCGTAPEGEKHEASAIVATPIDANWAICLTCGQTLLEDGTFLSGLAPTLPSPRGGGSNCWPPRYGAGSIYNRLQFLPCAQTHPRGPNGPFRRRRAGASRWWCSPPARECG